MPLDYKVAQTLKEICVEAVQTALTPIKKQIEQIEKSNKTDTELLKRVQGLEARDIAKDLTKLVEFKMKELFPEPIEGPRGEKGEKGDQGPAGPEGPAGKDGKDGKDGESIDFGQVMSHIEKYLSDNINEWLLGVIPKEALEPPEKGEKGDPGEKGEKGDTGPSGPAGADGPQGLPGKDAPAVTSEQVKAAVLEIYPIIRKDIVADLPRIEHKGPYNEGQTYYAGDEVMKDDSTWRALRQTEEAPPGEDWQCVAKSKVGKKGLRGPQGEKGDIGADGASGKDGKDGRGIMDIHLSDDGMLNIVLDDGEVKGFNVTNFLSVILNNQGDE